MQIAILGWGSLIWCPGSLRIRTRWHSNGPSLPIEFARISKDERVTLVIHPGAPDQMTYWALSEFDKVVAARENLRLREGPRCKPADIHTLGPVDTDYDHDDVRQRIQRWLSTRREVDAVVWTGLPCNWKRKRGEAFSVERAIDYLTGLRGSAAERARQYVCNAPRNIDTPVRRGLRQRGWSDAELPSILLDEDEP
jgi:hypothetical protein